MASPAAGRTQDIEASRTIASIMRQSGDSWWAMLDRRQLSPTSLADGHPLLGTTRVILAAASLEHGYRDRRWATTDEMAGLGYGSRRDERPTTVPVEQGGASQPEGIAYVALFNAEQLRGRRGGGVRTGSKVPPERPEPCDHCATANAIARAALTLMGIRALVAHMPETWEAQRASRLLEAAALVSMRDHAETDQDPIETLALVANIAAAMAFSDLGVPPACARANSVPTRETPLRWAETIQSNPKLLLCCATRAEIVANRLSEAVRAALAMPNDGKERPVPKAPAGKGVPGCRPMGDGRHRTDGQPPTAAPGDAGIYTLRSVAEESRFASVTLAGTKGMGR